jgi:AcrR family transcriptional regulator
MAVTQRAGKTDGKADGKPAGKAGAETKAGRPDWIMAALTLLGRGGIDAVRVEPLAEKLGVTKGSFYWHFKDRDALHAAMLEAWQAGTTQNVIDRVEKESRSRDARLGRLITIAIEHSWAARLETAVRAWAKHDERAAKAITEVDAQRLDYIAMLLRELGIETRTARLRAQIIYLMLIGAYFAGGVSNERSQKALWAEVERLMMS